MKRLVIIAGIVYPESTPPGKIAMQFAEVLKKKFDVSMIIMQSSLLQLDGKEHNGIKLFSVLGLRYFLELWFQNKFNNTKYFFMRKVSKYAVIFLKVLGRIQNMVIFPNNLQWYYKGALRKLIYLNNQKKIDVIFSICNPFPAHMAAMKFKENNIDVRWVTYTVDPYATSERLNNIALLPKYRNKYNTEYESMVYSIADYNLVSEEVYQFESNLFCDFKHKTKSLPYLIFKPEKKSKNYFDNSKINLVYTGRFYKDIRNPDYFLESISKIYNNSIQMHLFSQSNCENIIDMHINNSGGRIVKHPLVSANEVINVLLDANILINIGNSNSSFKPSKIFEYISTGKPIINFYRNNNLDEVLLKYPLALQINEDTKTPIESAQIIEDFCLKAIGNELRWEEIEALYPLNSSINITSILLNAFKISR
jgi:hypothetical protein